MISHSLPFRLILDVQAIQSEMHSERGIARFTAEHARALLEYEDLVTHLSLNPCRPFPKNPDPALLFSGKLAWGGLPLIRNEAGKGPVVYYTMSPIEFSLLDSLYPRKAVGTNTYFATTLYDLIPLLFPDIYLRDGHVRAQYEARLELVKAADLVCAISESAREDAIRELHIDPEKVHVIGGGVSTFFKPCYAWRQDARLVKSAVPGLRGRFIFTVLGEDPRKNLDRLLKAYTSLPAALRNQYQLLVGGKYREIAIQNISLQIPEDYAAGRVVFTRYTSDECLRALYRTCSLFVFPPIYEGFGLPVAEAASCGARVITSNASSVPEVLNSPLTTFDPYSIDSMRDAMEKALTDRKHASQLSRIARAKVGELGWEKVAARTVRALASMGKTRRLVSIRKRLAVGFAGPFPPVPSGIADYNYYIARELAKLVDLHIFYTEGTDPGGLRRIGAAGRRPVSDLGTALTPGYLDHLIYTLGNSEHHIQTYEMALKFPGLLWLHEARLFGFYYMYCRSKEDAPGDRLFLRETERMYPHRVPPPCSGLEPFDLGAVRDWGIGYTRDVVRAATGLILNSSVARDLLELDQGPAGKLPPDCIVPLACHEPSFFTRLPTRDPNDCPTILSLGLVDWVKAPDLIIDAFASVRKVHPCRLVFLGPVSMPLKQDLLNHAARIGVRDSVQFTDFVAEQEWFEWICRSHCAVLLRRRTNGESSAAVAACMAAGLPVITNVASCQEMPDDSRDFVPFDVTQEQLRLHISDLFTDNAKWMRLHCGELRYAKEHTYSKIARRLVRQLEAGFGAVNNARETAAKAIAAV